MAKKNIITLPVTSSQWSKEWTDLQDYFHDATFASTFKRSDKKPFVIWHDESVGVYRFFPDEEKRDIWIETYLNMEDGEVMPPEIAAYEFIEGGIIAPAPYTMNIVVSSDNSYILEGERGTTLDFTVETVDGNGNPLRENVNVYYTFRSSSASKSISASYSYVDGEGIAVSMNVDKYLTLGKNSITIVVKGKSSGATKTYVATYNVVKFNLTSTFNIAISRKQDSPFEVAYTIEGEGDKAVKFYIDGDLVDTDRIPISEGTAPVMKRHTLSVSNAGKHNLQLVGEMTVGNRTFKSKLLYYEFIVTGIDLTTVVISAIFDADTEIISKIITPYLQAEQYVAKVVNWAYYSSNPLLHNATVKWSLYNEQNGEIPLSTRVAEVVEAETGTPPEPLRFMPTVYGHYYLKAYINNNGTYEPMREASYEINIIQNSNGISETTGGLTMKLSGFGRSNTEPLQTLSSWESTIIRNNRTFHYYATFYNQPWNNNSGWVDGALVLNNGATCVINNKPFGTDIFPTENNGCCFEIDFETFNVTDPDSEVLRIGGLGTAELVITADKAMIKSQNGSATLISRFKANERIKIAFVVYPKDSTEYYAKVFVYNNGVMSGVRAYTAGSDNFNIGNNDNPNSSIGVIYLGNAVVEDSNHNESTVCGTIPNNTTVVGCDSGIKIYYIRTYDNFINMYQELNNYVIDSGEDIAYFVEDNDIYNSYKEIDISKLESTITTVKFTGDIGSLIGTFTKDRKIPCALEIVSPTNPDIYLTCDFAQVNKAGQSTLEKPVPSLHVRLDKIEGNVCRDKDGNMWPRNRWAFKAGNTPEKKFRLQANYMDSSCCHNAAFFRMINEVYPKVEIAGEGKVLRMPARAFIEDDSENGYAALMQAKYGDDPSGNNWKFPYNLNFAPDSIPCIVVWRRDVNDDYKLLGQYVIMEEKKANYANGMHSIYDGVDTKGFADPFGFKTKKSDRKLWDNEDCHQMEFVRQSGLDFVYDYSNWDTVDPSTGITGKEYAFEIIYPDDDDLIDKAREEGKPDNYYINLEWNKFFNDVIKPVADTYDPEHPEIASANFSELFYGPNPKLDRWGFAAYYCLVLRHACSDSLARNLELVTFDGNIWTPKWWDADMQCGLEQSGYCIVEPGTDRDTKLSPDLYALSGRVIQDGVLSSSWLWDGLTGNAELGIPANEQFMADVAAMDDALFRAGWTYDNVIRIQDEEYVNTWSKALYNESGIVKYINYGNDELNYISLQGERTPHRHWFLRTSYDYFDALNICGEYTSKVLKAKLSGISHNYPKKIYITAASTSYFGWRATTQLGESGVKIEKGETKYLTLDKDIDRTEFTAILGANKISSIDFSEISTNFFAQIEFQDHTDNPLDSSIREIIMGASITRLNNGEFNTNTGTDIIGGISTLRQLEHLDIRGMYTMTNIELSSLQNLNRLNAAGTSLVSFSPADGCDFSSVNAEVELPTTVTMFNMSNCKLTKNNDCVITWYDTILEDDVPVGVQSVTVPSSIASISCNGMGRDLGTKILICDWLNAVNDDNTKSLENVTLTCNNVNWSGETASDPLLADIDDLLLIAEIPYNGRKNFGGYICLNSVPTAAQAFTLQQAFPNCFINDSGVQLRIDSVGNGFMITMPSEILAGESYNISAVVFPITDNTGNNMFVMGHYINGTFNADISPITEGNRTYYRETDTIDGEEVIIASLCKETGELITYEQSKASGDYHVGIRGSNGIVGDDAPLTIKKRTYPSAIDFDVKYPTDKNVSFDSGTNQWFITSDDLDLTINVIQTPEETDGTLLPAPYGSIWRYDNINSAFGTYAISDNSLTLRIPSQGIQEEVDGIIKHIKNYVGGYSVEVEYMFRFKIPVNVITSNGNFELQTYLWNGGNGIASNANYTFDTDAWKLTTLNSYGILSSGSTIKHLAEINCFKNITRQTMPDLDLHNCTSLGTITSPKELEDLNYYYVDVLPRRDLTLAFEFEHINMAGTHLKGINLIQNSNVLESITYSGYTENIELIGQSALIELNIESNAANTLDNITIINCNNLEEITWI